MSIEKLLIANRGEIALRIHRACHELGIKTVAVHSTADADAMHVRLADEAICIGPPAAKDSYLNIANIISAAEISGADAIHPGYGFLSENAQFAEIVEAHGLIFVGPKPEHIRIMGDKVEAKRTAGALGLPLVPGSDGAISDLGEAKKIAEEIGYPVLIKAASGGGGRGMKVVAHADELETLMAQAGSEAKSAFGDATVYMEKYLGNPRHIEFQVFGDGKGNAIHLGERDCSLQRRHQKVIEEGPATQRARERLAPLLPRFIAALTRMRYQGAGTLELLHDLDADALYFMEVNPRIQVEHPVTECLVGVDLVRLQLELALGRDPEPLRLSVAHAEQHALVPRGHAVEARLVAEDPAHDYAPETGTLRRFELGQAPFARWDAGYREGARVSAHYDGLLAKLIVWGETRAQALERMAHVLDATHVHGVRTNLPLLRSLVVDPMVVADQHDTGTLDRRAPVREHAETAPLDAAVLREAWRRTEPVAPVASSESSAATPSAGERWREGHRR